MGKGSAFISWLQINALAVLFLVVLYQAWYLPAYLSLAVMAVGNLYWLARNHQALKLPKLPIEDFLQPSTHGAMSFAAIAMILDAALLAIFYKSACTATLVSPWDVIPAAVWIIFPIATMYAVPACHKLRPLHAWFLAVLHSFVIFSVIGFAYVNGFGYDVFVHEATVAYIRLHGFILPKKPYYIGAYVIMLPFLEMTGMAAGTLLRWLLPVLAAIFLPSTLYVCSDKPRPVPYWILWMTLYAPFTFSVPYNIALLFAVMALLLVALNTHLDSDSVVLADVGIQNQKASGKFILFWIPDFSGMTNRMLFAALCLSLVSACSHPMVGFPVLVIVLLLGLFRRLARSLSFGFVATFFAVLVPLFVYVRLSGGAVLIPTFYALWDSACILFHSPAVFSWTHPLWSLLYALYAIWPWILFAFGIYGLRKSNRLLIGSSLGVIAAAILSAATLRYRDIVPQEQYEFAYRLIALAPWIVFPGLVALALDVQTKLTRKFAAVWLVVLSLLITAAWFVAYPQYNPAMPYFAPSISSDELSAAAWIESTTAGKTHVVLAPQLVSAGALRLVGFGPSIKTSDGDIYPYAIPTGGNLYRLYLEAVSGMNLNQTLNRVADYAKVQTYVFVIPSSWDPYGVLTGYFSALASRQTRIGELGVYVIDRMQMGQNR